MSEALMSFIVIASEAKQSSVAQAAMDCFAPLAMTIWRVDKK
jgi:hypothetical protein